MSNTKLVLGGFAGLIVMGGILWRAYVPECMRGQLAELFGGLQAPVISISATTLSYGESFELSWRAGYCFRSPSSMTLESSDDGTTWGKLPGTGFATTSPHLGTATFASPTVGGTRSYRVVASWIDPGGTALTEASTPVTLTVPALSALEWRYYGDPNVTPEMLAEAEDDSFEAMPAPVLDAVSTSGAPPRTRDAYTITWTAAGDPGLLVDAVHAVQRGSPGITPGTTHWSTPNLLASTSLSQPSAGAMTLTVPMSCSGTTPRPHRVRVGTWRPAWAPLAVGNAVAAAQAYPDGLVWSAWSGEQVLTTQAYEKPRILDKTHPSWSGDPYGFTWSSLQDENGPVPFPVEYRIETSGRDFFHEWGMLGTNDGVPFCNWRRCQTLLPHAVQSFTTGTSLSGIMPHGVREYSVRAGRRDPSGAFQTLTCSVGANFFGQENPPSPPPPCTANLPLPCTVSP